MHGLSSAKLIGFSYTAFYGLILGLLCVNSVTSSRSSACNLRFHFACKSDSNICIPLIQLRDGKRDCPDGSDEELTCPDGYFQCRSGKGCVPREKVRDGVSDCSDGSDEDCPSGMHRCRCGIPKCISRNLVSDGVQHCVDGSDEGEDNSNFICPDAINDQDFFAVERKKRRRRDTDEEREEISDHVVPSASAESLMPVGESESFESLRSGKVYLTAVSEPKSSLSTTILSTNQIDDGIDSNKIRNDPTRRTEITSALQFMPKEKLRLSASEEHGYFREDKHAREIRDDSIYGDVKPDEMGMMHKDYNNRGIEALSPSKPIAITRYVESTLNARGAFVPSSKKTNSEIMETIRSGIPLLRGHSPRTRHGRLYNPASVSARKVHGNEGTIIDDEFIVPDHMYQTVRRIPTSEYDPNDSSYDKAYYHVNEDAQKDEIANQLEILSSRPTNELPDKRITRTVGFYGPIYDNYYEAHATDVNKDSLQYPSSNSGNNNANLGDEKTITLFGFAQFSTKISGTNYVFMPASTQPRTYTPKVSTTKVSTDLLTTSRSASSYLVPFNSRKVAYTRQPLFGTETREFVSQMSMYTSTIMEPVETVQATMFTSTVPTKTLLETNTRIPKLDDETKVAETLPLNLDTVYKTEADRSSIIGPQSEVLLKIDDTRTKENTKDLHVSHILDDSNHELEEAFEHPTGLVSSITGTEVTEDMTTHWTTLIFGTYIGNTYAHVIESTSSIFYTLSKTEPAGDTFLDGTYSSHDTNIIPSILPSSNPEDIVSTFEIISSLTETQGSSQMSSIPTEKLSASNRLQILTSGFILPSFLREESSKINSASATENPLNSLDSDLHRSMHDDSGKLLKSGVIYAELSNKNITSSDSISAAENRKHMNSDDDDIRLAIMDIDSSLLHNRETVVTNIQASSLLKSHEESSLSSIITDGFILPDVSESTLVVKPGDLESTSRQASDTLSILTDGFILPQEVTATTNEVPNLEGITAAPLIGQPHSVSLNLLEESQLSARSAGIENRLIILDHAISPSPTEKDVEDSKEPDLIFLEESKRLKSNNDFDAYNIEGRQEKAVKSRPQKKESSYGARISSIVDNPIIESLSSSIFPLEVKSTISASELLPSLVSPDANLYSDNSAGSLLDKKPDLTNTFSTEEESITANNLLKPTVVQPTTYYTTYTYFTTFHKDGTTSVNTRLQTVSNVIYGSLTPSLEEAHEKKIELTKTPLLQNDMTVLKPTTYFTTYTYYTTFLRSGQTIVSSREEIVSTISGGHSVATPALSSTNLITKSSDIASLKTTFYTTFTYYTTLLKQGTTTVSTRKETITNIMHGSPTKDVKVKTTESSERSIVATPVVNTYFTTYTYFTTFIRDGSPSVSSRESTATNIVTEKIRNSPSFSTGDLTRSFATYYTTLTSFYTLYNAGIPSISTVFNTLTDIVALTPVINLNSPISTVMPTPATETYLTTYTYYTTLLENNVPKISSRKETVTNVVTLSSSGSDIYKDPSMELSTSIKLNTVDPVPSLQKEFDIIPTTYTYYTTFFISGTPSITTRYETLAGYAHSEVNKDDIVPIKTIHTPQLNLPVTHYTTYTYVATEIKNNTSAVHTKTHIVSNVMDTTSAPKITNIKPLQERTQVKTFFTTYTYYTTLYSGTDTNIDTRYKTVTNVVTNTIQPIVATITRTDLDEAEGEFYEKSVHPTPVFSYYTTRTFVTASIDSNGQTQFSTRRVSAIATLEPSQNVVETLTATLSPSHRFCCDSFPHTDYTTHTYYTTRFHGGQPQINTRYEIITNVIKSPVGIETTPVESTNIHEGTHESSVIENNVHINHKNDIDRAVRNHIGLNYGTEQSDFSATTEAADEKHLDDINSGNHASIPSDIEPMRTLLNQSTVEYKDNVTVVTEWKLEFESTTATEGILLNMNTDDAESTTATSPTTDDSSSNQTIKISTTSDGDESNNTDEDTTMASPTTSSRKSIFGRRNRPLFRPKPTIRSFSTPLTTPQTTVKTTTRSTLPIGRRNSTRGLLFRPPNPLNRTLSLRRLRRPGVHLVDDSTQPNRKKRSFFLPKSDYQSLPTRRKILNTNIDDEYTLSLKQNNLIFPETIPGSASFGEEYPLGLLRSVEARAINDGTTTIYATEIHGTFINGNYAQVVQSKVRVQTESTNEIHRTDSPYNVHPTPAFKVPGIEKATNSMKVGLVSSILHTSVDNGVTTIYATSVYGTYVGDVYAHVAQTTSSILTPVVNSYSTGLLSSITNTEVNDDMTTAWTTNIYGTFVNGYYAHVASTHSSILPTFSNSYTKPTLLPPGFQNHMNFPTGRMASHQDLARYSNIDYENRANENRRQSVGLLSSFVSDSINAGGTTTQFITNVFGTFIGHQYAQHVQTTSRVILPTMTEGVNSRSVGLVSTIVRSVVNDNTATLYKTEVYGTYIGDLYAQIARTSTEIKVLPSKTVDYSISPTQTQKTGLITSSIIRSEVFDGTTTLHVNDIYGTYIGNAYAHIARSTTSVIEPGERSAKFHDTTSSVPSVQSTGLVSSSVSTEINSGTTTLHTAEIHGTYIGNYYAHIARRTSSILPFTASSVSSTKVKLPNSEGLISADVRTEVNYGTTTLHTREIYGTSINGYYAHVARSTSKIIDPIPVPSRIVSNTGLVSVITSSEYNQGVLTLHTTEIYGTSINGYYAHIARKTSNVIASTFVEAEQPKTGVITVSTSTVVNNFVTTVYESSTIGTKINGHYTQSVEVSSSILNNPEIHTKHINSFNDEDAKASNSGDLPKDFIESVIINQVDRDNNNFGYDSSKLQFIKPSLLDVISSSIISNNVLEMSEKETPSLSRSNFPDTKIYNIQNHRLFPTDLLIETKSAKIEIAPTTSSYSLEGAVKYSKTPVYEVASTMLTTSFEDYDEYSNGNKQKKDKNIATSKPSTHSSSKHRDEVEENKPQIQPLRKNLSKNKDFEDYDFEDDYDDFEAKRNSKNFIPSRVRGEKSTQTYDNHHSSTKAMAIPKDYDEYTEDEEEDDIYDYSDSIHSTSTKGTKIVSTKTENEVPPSSVKIRPFVGRGRPTFGTPVRTSAKSSFTIQFRRPSRTRNSKAFGQRSDSDQVDEFDDSINEDHEDNDGDIEASEAVVTTATPQALPVRRNKFRSSTRQQTFSRTTTQPSRQLNVRRNQRIFGRSSASPSPTQTYKNIKEPDYEENITEEEEFDEYDDIYEKNNDGHRNSRFTRRPSPRRVFGERRSASNKRGAFRHREDEEIENEDFDATTPDYRSSRNRPNQRKSARGRQNRNRSPSLKASFNSVIRDEDEDSQSLQPVNRIRNNNRNRRPSYNPRTKRNSKSSAETTTTVYKPHLTVTSVVTTVKTLPIYHGFRTSYATLTTTALDTSIINPSQYSTVISDGLTKTLYSSKIGYPDGFDNMHTTITEIVITTTSLASVKLVPIKIGFSTRTDTITDIQVLTTLSTVYSTISPDAPTPTAFPQQFQPPFYPQLPPQNQDYGLLTSVATQIVTSTTIIPIVLRGRTILSTLTTTSTAQQTVIQTPSLRLPQVPSAAPFIHQPYFAFQPITTLLTLYVTGDHGELKPVITTVTVPLYQQPVFHTKVARSLQSSPTDLVTEHTEKAYNSFYENDGIQSSRDIDIGTHYDKLLSSGLEEINDMSELSSSSQTQPLDSTFFSGMNDDITTLSKGPLTEIYIQKATISSKMHGEHSKANYLFESDDAYGIGAPFAHRKLQQFVLDDDGSDFRPQRDFTRIRRPPAHVFRPSVVETNIQPTRPLSNTFDQLSPRRPPAEIFADGSIIPESFRPIIGEPRRGQGISRRVPQRPPSNFRTFIENPSPVNFVANENAPRGFRPVTNENIRDERFSSPAIPTRNRNNLNNLLPNFNFPTSNDGGFQPLNHGPSGLPVENIRNSFDPVLPFRRIIVTRPLSGGSSGGIRRVTRTRPSDIHSTSNQVNPLENELPPSTVIREHSIASNTIPLLDDEDLELLKDYDDLERVMTTSVDSNALHEATLRKTISPSFVPGDGSGARRPVLIRRTRTNLLSSSAPIESNAEEIATSSVLSEDSSETPSASAELELPLSADSNENSDDSDGRKPLRKVIRVRRPEGTQLLNSLAGQRRRLVVTRKPQDSTQEPTTAIAPIQARGPVVPGKDFNEVENFVRDIENKEEGPIKHSQLESSHLSKTFPVTYFTTLTYFTTFLHGTNINYASRQAVFSNVIDQTLNPSIISIIKTKNGLIIPSTGNKIVPLASRTLGDTTTIVNLASRQNIFNSELNQLLSREDADEIVPTSAPVSSYVGNTRARPIKNEESMKSNLNEIAILPKTYVTLFTYLYTFYDGQSTRQSARSETITSLDNNPTAFLTASLGTSIDGFGFLNVGPESRIVKLGSREVEGTTTEVNLDLRTLIHFDNLRNVVLKTAEPSIDISPSKMATEHTSSTHQIFSSERQPDRHTFDYDTLQPSYDPQNELFGSKSTSADGAYHTPVLPNVIEEFSNSQEATKPILKVTSIIHNLPGHLRSGVFTPRPGVRVRVRPVTSRRTAADPVLSSFDIAHNLNEISEPFNVVASPGFDTIDIEDMHTEIGYENEVVEHDIMDTQPEDGESQGPRKRLKITVRRQPSESVNRTHTRFVLPSRFEITSRPRFYVVTRTGALGVVSPSQRPFTKITRKLKPSAADETENTILLSSTVIYETYTTLTTVPVIFGLETSFRNVIVTTSSPVTISAPITIVPDIQPSNTVVLTYFTTTTYTIPYLDGDQTLYTFLEETNSRVVTQTFDGLEPLTYSTVSRPISDQTSDIDSLRSVMSVELGPDGPTTHIVPISSMVPSTLQSIPSLPSPKDALLAHDTKTFYTTYTLFTTFYSGTDAFISSSEQVVSNVVTVPVDKSSMSVFSPLDGPVTVFETSTRITTKTLLNTVTFYATLFSDTSSFVTPIEEIQTELQTVTDTFTITRTSSPESSFSTTSPASNVFATRIEDEPSITFTQTLYTTFTNFVTLFQGSGPVVTSLEEIVSNVVTLTVPVNQAISSKLPSMSLRESFATPTFDPPSYTTREVLSTQTHYLTLFNGDQQILSSIEEVVTNYIMESAVKSTAVFEPETSFKTSIPFLISSDLESVKDTEPAPKVHTYQAELVPSIRTLYSTLTFYTTYFSGSSSIVASQEEVLTSYVTLFVPPSLITATESKISASSSISVPLTTTDPSVFVFTTTDYSTLTLYTTLFNGDETVIISSEHVVPDIITATITPTQTSSLRSQTSEESVLTFLTTFTYYTTYFSGAEPVIASSESVVTQYITIDSAPTTSLLAVDYTSSPDETIIGVATVSGSHISSSFVDDIADSEIVGVSSNVMMDIDRASSVMESAIITKVQTDVASSVSVQPVFIKTEDSKPALLSSSYIIPEKIETITKISTETLETVKEGSTVIFFTDIVLPSSKEATQPLPKTSSSVVTKSTEIIGFDGKITTISPSATLMLVTGVDGFVTKFASEKSSSPEDIMSKLETPVNEVKPATVIELSDLLGGSTALGGDIGLAIQDIVSLITGKRNKTESDISTESTTENPTTDETLSNGQTTREKVTYLTTEITDAAVDTTTEKTTENRKTTLSDVSPMAVETVAKDFDYPVFVLPSVDKERITESDVAIPVYIPQSKTSSSTSRTMSSAKSTPKQNTSPIVSTSVITGARTIFITPTRASTLRSTKETLRAFTIEGRSSPSDNRVINLPQLSTHLNVSPTSDIDIKLFSNYSNFIVTESALPVFSSDLTSSVNTASVSLQSSRPYTTLTTGDKTILSRTTSGATTIFFPGQIPKNAMPVISTRYVTSVESITRTLALTSTKTYYTRDTTLTVPSVYTTTIPPRTFVSTIIGKRTILGILPEPSETIQLHKTTEPSERTTTVTTTTLIFNSIPSTIVRTLVLPTTTYHQNGEESTDTTDFHIFSAGTEKPANPPQSADSISEIEADQAITDETIEKNSLQKQRDETYLRAANPRIKPVQPVVNVAGVPRKSNVVVIPAVRPQDDPFLNGRNGICDPKCLSYKREICAERNGFWKCRCRPGHARKNDHEICREIQSFLLLLKVMKMNNTNVNYGDMLSDPTSNEYRDLVDSTKEGISEIYHYTNVREHYLGAEVNDIMPAGSERIDSNLVSTTAPDDNGIIVNVTVQVSKSVSKKLLEQELLRSLQMTDKRIGDSLLLIAPLSQTIQDFDECSSSDYNDCSSRARCQNLEGSYTCQCLEGFEDKDPKSPGRTCFEKTENCEYCYGRGDCLESDDNQVFCRCLPMYVGRRCEVNGLVLAVALPTAVAVLVVLLCVALCCCRKCRRKTPPVPGVDPSIFRGIALKGPMDGTLDRKAMIDSSSESSGEHGRRNHSYDGYQESGDITPIKGSKRSDISLNRSLSTNYAAAPVMIPRAKPQGPKPNNYTVYNGQVYVW